MLARLKPPDALRARLCWIMLAVSLWVIGSVLPMLVFGSPAQRRERASSIAHASSYRSLASGFAACR